MDGGRSFLFCPFSPTLLCPVWAWAAEWDRVVPRSEPGCQAARTAGFLY